MNQVLLWLLLLTFSVDKRGQKAYGSRLLTDQWLSAITCSNWFTPM